MHMPYHCSFNACRTGQPPVVNVKIFFCDVVSITFNKPFKNPGKGFLNTKENHSQMTE